MALLPVLVYPDQRLRNQAKPVVEVTDETRKIVEDMFETMYEDGGVGLASIQVDIQQRIVTIDVSESRDEPLTLINPEILEKHDEKEGLEGCLSFPGVFDKIKRAERIKFKALDKDGKEYTMDAEGLLAVCVQHEIDHLDGKLLIDYLSPLKKGRLLKKLEKHKKLRM
jgi:peptide deformylase